MVRRPQNRLSSWAVTAGAATFPGEGSWGMWQVTQEWDFSAFLGEPETGVQTIPSIWERWELVSVYDERFKIATLFGVNKMQRRYSDSWLLFLGKQKMPQHSLPASRFLFYLTSQRCVIQPPYDTSKAGKASYFARHISKKKKGINIYRQLRASARAQKVPPAQWYHKWYRQIDRTMLKLTTSVCSSNTHKESEKTNSAGAKETLTKELVICRLDQDLQINKKKADDPIEKKSHLPTCLPPIPSQNRVSRLFTNIWKCTHHP